MVTVGYIVMGIANVVVTVQTKYKDKHSTRHILDVAFAHSIFGVVTDFYILMIPIPLIAPLRLPLGRKLGVCAIFLTGLV